jgi:hypothetical protein
VLGQQVEVYDDSGLNIAYGSYHLVWF